MITKGYHTLEDRDNVNYIEEWGPRPCTKKNAWLGDGCYFWDGDIDWAHDWGKKNYKEYMIFEGNITIDENTYDLVGNILHKKEFYSAMQVLLDSGHFKSLDSVKVSGVIEYLKKFIGFKYNSIRSVDYPSRALTVSFGGNHNEFMYLNERVQICLITKNNLSLQTFRVIHPEKYVE